MAKRMKSKIQPAAQTLLFQFNRTQDINQYEYIDLSQVASLVNRRFYRQGLNWAVAGFKITCGTRTDGFVSVNKLPNTWVMSNAWEKSFRAWQQMIKNATDESGSQSVKGKFLDYKIHMNENHFDEGFANNLMPTSAFDGSYHPATNGQWDASDIVIPNTTTSPGATITYQLMAVGGKPAGKNVLSIIEGYENSRALPSVNEPNTPDEISTTENWLLAMFNDGNQQDIDVVDILEGVGDVAPYPFENSIDPDTGLPFTGTMYPNGENQMPSLQYHDGSFITSSTIGGSTYLKGGNFPCGLMEIYMSGLESGDSILLQVDLVPGSHRGYLCESMTEM